MDFRFNEKQQALIKKIKEVSEKELIPIQEEFGEQDVLSFDMVRALAKNDFYRMHIPVEYGGLNEAGESNATMLCITREELARQCPLAESTYSVTCLGSFPILLAGTEEQKKHYLGKMTSGEEVFAFALTEPNAGSDAVSLQTTAVLDGDEWLINGKKIFISNAGDAGVYVVFARTSDAPGSKGISTFIVEADNIGLEVTQRLSMIAPHPIGELTFHNCRVPKESLLGEEGRGFKYAMQSLDMFRSSVGAQLVGFAEAALEHATEYARQRHAFGGPITQFQAIQFKLADMYMEIQAAKNLVYYAAHRKDLGNRVTKEAAIAKLYASQVAQRVAYEGQQIFGGYGMIKGNPLELIYREVRPAAIYEGSTEIQHMVIGRGMINGSFIDESLEKVLL
jgi:alkylation response protein AidB-like acyl-CoA dehydrogenase